MSIINFETYPVIKIVKYSIKRSAIKVVSQFNGKIFKSICVVYLTTPCFHLHGAKYLLRYFDIMPDSTQTQLNTKNIQKEVHTKCTIHISIDV